MIWKLLRRHISKGQLAGFFLANLFGMSIVMFACQFYSDVKVVFTAPDSFLKSGYIIICKKTGAAGTFAQESGTFTAAEIDDISAQPFAASTAAFVTAEYKTEARIGIAGSEAVTTDIAFESVPDEFVDVDSDKWRYAEGQTVVPVILPRSYIAMYNFGLAQGKSLPRLTEGTVGMIDLVFRLQGNGGGMHFKGEVIGFSNRINSILVPMTFMEWSNRHFAPDVNSRPLRIIMKTRNPADAALAEYVETHGYDTDDDNLQAGKTTWFLRLIVTMVLAVGLVITMLSFYILMLSIYLLVQKNTDKLQNLLLIGYSPHSVARPYQLLAMWLNLSGFALAVGIVWAVRCRYMDVLTALFPDIPDGNMMPSMLCGFVLFLVVTALNVVAVNRKTVNLWKRK